MPPNQYPTGQMPPSPLQGGAMPPSGYLPKRNHHGVLIALIIVSVLFVGSAAFAIWAFMGRQDYKNNVNQKIAVAVQKNTSKVQSTDAANYAEQSKYPLKTYHGPSDYGSIVVKYPKTWSAYVNTSDASTPVDGYFQPDFVPSAGANSSNNFALRLQVLQQPYDQVLNAYTGQAQQTGIKISAYKSPNVANEVGVMITGAIQPNKQGVMVVLPLRTNTIELWTESDTQDFTKNILPNFTFSP